MASVLKVDKLDPQSGTALEIGTSGDTITIPSGATIVNSGTATGFGGGKILQVVGDLVTSQAATTSTDWQNSELYAAITPSSTSNKVYITAEIPIKCNKTSGSATTAASMDVGLFLTDVDGTTLSDGTMAYYATPSSSDNFLQSGWASFTYLHSPSTTSSTTYMIGFRSLASNWTATVFTNRNGDDCNGSMVLMEVDGT